MPKKIEELLHRRNDLSTFLVHLTRDRPGHAARDNLLDILTGREIEARTPMGLGKDYWQHHAAFAQTQKTVCFTETPLEHVWMMCEDIENRDVKMQPYGLAFTKTWARRRMVNPIMYVDITPTGNDWLTTPFNQMLESAAAGKTEINVGGNWAPVNLAASPIAKLTPFIEPMGKPGQVRREWWWEREWRKVGDLDFTWADVVVVFVPETDHAAFTNAFAAKLVADLLAPPGQPLRLLDPTWGQERMIAALAGVAANDVGPFPL